MTLRTLLRLNKVHRKGSITVLKIKSEKKLTYPMVVSKRKLSRIISIKKYFLRQTHKINQKKSAIKIYHP